MPLLLMDFTGHNFHDVIS